MGGTENAAPKQAGGRFRPGESGNPAGKPKGARNKTTIFVEKMIEGEAEALTATAIRLAKDGDPSLLRAMLDRLAPARKERTLSISLPPITSPADAPAIAARLIEAAAAGEITPNEAQALASLLEAYRRQSELADIEARLRALEDATRAKKAKLATMAASSPVSRTHAG